MKVMVVGLMDVEVRVGGLNPAPFVQEDPCPEKGRLQKVTLKTPVGAVAVYMEEGVNTTDIDFNNAFGIQWNMHGVGTLFDR